MKSAQRLRDAGRARKCVAMTLPMTAIAAAAYAARLVYISVMSCLVSCGPANLQPLPELLISAAIALVAGIAGVANFLFRLWKHGWSGLNRWEKSVAYVAIAALLAPLLVDLAFWLRDGVRAGS